MISKSLAKRPITTSTSFAGDLFCFFNGFPLPFPFRNLDRPSFQRVFSLRKFRPRNYFIYTDLSFANASFTNETWPPKNLPAKPMAETIKFLLLRFYTSHYKAKTTPESFSRETYLFLIELSSAQANFVHDFFENIFYARYWLEANA